MIVAGVANAAVFARLVHTKAKAGELVGAQVDAWTATHHPPLYLVPERGSFAFTTTRWPLRAHLFGFAVSSGAGSPVREQPSAFAPQSSGPLGVGS